MMLPLVVPRPRLKKSVRFVCYSSFWGQLKWPFGGLGRARYWQWVQLIVEVYKGMMVGYMKRIYIL